MTEKQKAQDRPSAADDEFYAALMEAHEGLSFEESARLNARLVLLLANEVGEPQKLRVALAAAREGVGEAG